MFHAPGFHVTPWATFNSGFYVTPWATFKLNRNQLGMVSAFVKMSVPWSNQSQVISEKLLSREFDCRTTGPQVNTDNCVHGKIKLFYR